jgi:hypothetical protein
VTKENLGKSLQISQITVDHEIFAALKVGEFV